MAAWSVHLHLKNVKWELASGGLTLFCPFRAKYSHGVPPSPHAPWMFQFNLLHSPSPTYWPSLSITLKFPPQEIESSVQTEIYLHGLSQRWEVNTQQYKHIALIHCIAHSSCLLMTFWMWVLMLGSMKYMNNNTQYITLSRFTLVGVDSSKSQWSYL